MRTKKKKGYAVISGCPTMYHKTENVGMGLVVPLCGAVPYVYEVERSVSRPKGRKLCGNCAKSKK